MLLSCAKRELEEEVETVLPVHGVMKLLKGKGANFQGMHLQNPFQVVLQLGGGGVERGQGLICGVVGKKKIRKVMTLCIPVLLSKTSQNIVAKLSCHFFMNAVKGGNADAV